jgi:hypothetical protein
MEGISSMPGDVQAAEAYLREWSRPQFDAGYLTEMYEGYADGLTMDQRLALAADGIVYGFWSDFAARVPPPGVGFQCKQYPTVTVSGIEIDPDHAYSDLRGKVLVGMFDGDLAVSTTDPAAGSGAQPDA